MIDILLALYMPLSCLFLPLITILLALVLHDVKILKDRIGRDGY